MCVCIYRMQIAFARMTCAPTPSKDTKCRFSPLPNVLKTYRTNAHLSIPHAPPHTHTHTLADVKASETAQPPPPSASPPPFPPSLPPSLPPSRPLLPDRALCLPTFSRHFLIVNKISPSLSLCLCLSLPLSLSPSVSLSLSLLSFSLPPSGRC